MSIIFSPGYRYLQLSSGFVKRRLITRIDLCCSVLPQVFAVMTDRYSKSGDEQIESKASHASQQEIEQMRRSWVTSDGTSDAALFDESQLPVSFSSCQSLASPYNEETAGLNNISLIEHCFKVDDNPQPYKVNLMDREALHNRTANKTTVESPFHWNRILPRLQRLCSEYRHCGRLSFRAEAMIGLRDGWRRLRWQRMKPS